MRMKLVAAVLQTGHSDSCVLALQAEHSTRWPQGIAACVAASDMQIWHSGSLMDGGAEGVLSSKEFEVEAAASDAVGKEMRWQLMLWLPSHTHCMQQCDTLPCDAWAVCAANVQPGLAHARSCGGGGGSGGGGSG
jgi:hypothetical protein